MADYQSAGLSHSPNSKAYLSFRRRFRHARNRALNYFFEVILVRIAIRQLLAFRTFDGKGRTFPIAHAEARAVGIAE
jgi:hypothetical protein